VDILGAGSYASTHASATAAAGSPPPDGAFLPMHGDEDEREAASLPALQSGQPHLHDPLLAWGSTSPRAQRTPAAHDEHDARWDASARRQRRSRSSRDGMTRALAIG
jgi:hypothetical protein